MDVKEKMKKDRKGRKNKGRGVERGRSEWIPSPVYPGESLSLLMADKSFISSFQSLPHYGPK